MAGSSRALLELAGGRCASSPPDLQTHEACLQISSSAQGLLHVLAQSSRCLQCDLLEWLTINPSTSVPLIVSSKYPLYMTFKSENDVICSFQHDFGGLGMYELNVSDSSCSDVTTLRKPEDAMLILLIGMLVMTAMWLTWVGLVQLVSSGWLRRHVARVFPSTAHVTHDTTILPDTPPSKGRVKSLDTFRGICIAVMIFVNYGGGRYLIFDHSIWNGLTIADILFPLFMWIMGLSMVFSMNSQLLKGVSRRQLILRVLIRGVKLILIGVCLESRNYNNSLADVRLPGVLQRLGASYVLAGVIEAGLASPRTVHHKPAWWQDLREAWLQWLVVTVIVATHCALTFALPVPGCPTGYLGPGGLHEHGQHEACTGGAAGHVDRVLLGDRHLYHHPTCIEVYRTVVPFDPEGLLGTLPSVLLVYLGVQAGRAILIFPSPRARVVRWSAWAVTTGLLAGALCGFSKDGGVIPINKNLYSVSFVLSNAALGFALLAALYLVVDVKQWWHGAPFYFAGMNSMLLYIGHGFTAGTLPWQWQPLSSSRAELLAMHVWGTALWLVIAYRLHRARIFFTV